MAHMLAEMNDCCQAVVHHLAVNLPQCHCAPPLTFTIQPLANLLNKAPLHHPPTSCACRVSQAPRSQMANPFLFYMFVSLQT